MAGVHFVVEQADGREMPVCRPEALPTTAASDRSTHLPERVTCGECIAALAGDAGAVSSSDDGDLPR